MLVCQHVSRFFPHCVIFGFFLPHVPFCVLVIFKSCMCRSSWVSCELWIKRLFSTPTFHSLTDSICWNPVIPNHFFLLWACTWPGSSSAIVFMTICIFLITQTRMSQGVTPRWTDDTHSRVEDLRLTERYSTGNDPVSSELIHTFLNMEVELMITELCMITFACCLSLSLSLSCSIPRSPINRWHNLFCSLFSIRNSLPGPFMILRLSRLSEYSNCTEPCCDGCLFNSLCPCYFFFYLFLNTCAWLKLISFAVVFLLLLWWLVFSAGVLSALLHFLHTVSALWKHVRAGSCRLRRAMQWISSGR